LMLGNSYLGIRAWKYEGRHETRRLALQAIGIAGVFTSLPQL
jgi:hypothetical protein